VQLKNILLCVTTIILCAGCGGVANKNELAPTPIFFTATLPPTLAPQATQTSIPPAPSIAVEEADLSSIEGMTTTQLNVRAEPSTASVSLGMIDIFAKVQVIGRDESGSWYQIIYAESEAGKGWVRAEYVQVNAPAEIPLVETTSSSGTAVSGLIIQKINVRNGPGTEYESLGVLNSNDVVFITGKDSSSAWIQIQFATAPDGKGWVTAEFLQVENLESVPAIGETFEVAATPTPGAVVISAMQDGDSMLAPLIAADFSPTGSRALQVNGKVSTPGDAEDWIQFTTYNEAVSIEVKCSGNTLRIELRNHEKPVDNFLLSCGDKLAVDIMPNSNYFLRLIQNEPGYTNYALSMEVIR